MTWFHIVLKSADVVPSFIAKLNANSIEFEQMSAVKTIFKINHDIDAFPLHNAEEIKDIVRNNGATARIQLELRTTNINLNSNTSRITPDSWAIARICRHKAPWNVDRIPYSVSTTFQCKRTGEGVDIYVLDSGLQPLNPEFEDRAFNLDGSKTNTYTYWHGVGVASCAAGKNYGVAKKALIWNISINDANGATDDAAMANGYNQALAHYLGRSGTNRPAIATLSTIGYGYSTPLTSAAIDACIDAGMVCTFAAGNNRTNTTFTPAYPYHNVPDAIPIGGVAMNDTPYYRSQYGTVFGPNIVLYAPSLNMMLAKPLEYGGNMPESGTSFAAPLGAGVAACMLQGYQRLTTRSQVVAVKQKMIDNATKNVIRENPSYRDELNVNPLVIEHNNLLYLDPLIDIEFISGLIPL